MLEKFNDNQENRRIGMNFTGQNVQKWSKLEKKLQEPLLQRMLPRRTKGVELSCYYRRLRVKLLIDNPHFTQDIRDLRKAFNISIKQLKDFSPTLFPDIKGTEKQIKAFYLEEVAGYWLEIHRHYFLKAPLGDWIPELPQWFMDSAHISPAFGEMAEISWLKKEPSVPERFIKYFNLEVPLDRCVVRLIERYQLPWNCGVKLQRFIVTGRRAYITSIFPFDIETKPVTTGIGQAFTITIDGIDEFMTRRDWNKVFDRYVLPQQKYYYESRGELPHSRRIDTDIRRHQEAFIVYKYIYSQLQAGLKIGVDRAIEDLSKQEKLHPDCVDRRNIFRQLEDLNILFKPYD